MSTASSGVDVSAKFQKLAAEYAKLRAQFPVLKNALLDEREKSANLEANLREKEQSWRALQVESESLVFRNQQLTKRVVFLQEQLEGAANNASSGTRFFRMPSASAKRGVGMKQSQSHDQFGSGGQTQTVLEEELKRKLEENESLNKRLFDLSSAHDQDMAEARDRIRVLESQLAGSQAELVGVKDRQEAVLAEVRSEKADACKELDIAQRRLDQCKRDCEQSQSLGRAMEAELADQREVISERVLFDDRGRAHWNALNVPVAEGTQPGEFVGLLSSFQTPVAQAAAHLALFHSYCKQRTELYPRDTSLGETLSPNSEQYCALFQKHADDSRAIERAFRDLVAMPQSGDDPSDLQSGFSALFDSYAIYQQFVNDSLPLVRKAVDEECMVDWCNARLDKENRAYADSYSQYCSAVTDLTGPLRCVLTPSAEPVPLDQLDAALDKLCASVKDLYDQYTRKIVHEHQLPVATRHMRTTNECVAAALNSAHKYMCEIVLTFRQNRPLIVRCSEEVNKARAELSAWKRLASGYHRTVELIPQGQVLCDKQPESSISLYWQDAQSTRPGGNSHDTELRALVEEKQRAIVALEKENEKLLLEAQLLRMKLDQCRQQEHSLRPGCEQPRASPSAAASSDWAYAEEYYGNRIAELNSKLQDANSRLCFFQAECHCLLKMITVYQKQKEKLQADTKLAVQQKRTLTDELETTRKEYESQLSTLSEHLAQMNQRLTKQTDEIDALRRPSGDKVQRKSRFT